MKTDESTMARNGLRRALEGHAATTFPPDSEDAFLGELHAELAEYDAFIVGRVTSLLGGERMTSESLSDSTRLRHALEAASMDMDATRRETAAAYLQYLLGLEGLATAARKVIET